MITLSVIRERYYQLFYRLFNIKNYQSLFPIDFDKEWWRFFASQKLRLVLVITPQILKKALDTLTAFLLGIILVNQRVDWLFYFVGVWFLVILLVYISDFNFALVQVSTQSVQYYAHQFLLKIDPIFHATRSTGQILAKIERAQTAYRELLDITIHDLLLTGTGMFTVVFTFWRYNPALALLTCGLLFLLAFFAIASSIFNNTVFITRHLQAEDAVRSTGVENLSQVTLIRSTFAGDEAMHKLYQCTQKSVRIERASWGSFYLLNVIMRFIYFSIFLLLALYLFCLISKGVITSLTGTTLLITFFRGTYDITKIGRRVYWCINATSRINDLFSFLRTFGHQTFPALSDAEHPFELPLNRENNIIVEAKNLHFTYNDRTKIFDGHSLILTVAANQKNKLYGMIGPSGVGKTTLLSILGGQLKPHEGTVTINGIDIYAIDDHARRALITMQNQTSTTFKGSARDNLLFGLSNEKIVYTDEQLINVLTRVGLWKILSEKAGLETSIGEGGLTLSGGQRQRFNFASVYLRAHYYKPLLILMDEPTSSLDEVSEHAINMMIDELATHSVVFVIAHRFNTLKNAQALLDISMIKQTTKLRFYPPHILMEKSPYYRALIEGTINPE